MRIDKKYNKKILISSKYLQKKVLNLHKYNTLIILGTGYNKIANTFNIIHKISYKKIPFWPECTAPYHEGNLIFAEHKGKHIIIMQGRHHFYEGYDMDEIAFPIYVLSKLNVKNMFCCNAAASLNKKKFKIGDICLISDHINGYFNNPIINVNVEHIKPRWLIPYDIYSLDLREKALNIAKENKIKLQEGIYYGYIGGMFETKAEAKIYKNYADMLSMSIIPEVIAAFHSNMKICAFSTATVYSLGDNENKIDESIIMEQTEKIALNLEFLFKSLIETL